MKKQLKKLLKQLKKEKRLAFEEWHFYYTSNDKPTCSIHFAKMNAFSFCIDELEKILKANEQNKTTGN
jgi:hypothetical protein